MAARTIPERKLADAMGGEDPFFSVFRAELDEIRKRRERPGGATRPSLAAAGPDTRKPSTGYGLIGLALSGGGVRSAAICLGAVQSLATKEVGLINRVDYLSTVSGGGYIGAAMTAGMSESAGIFPFPSSLGSEENLNLRKIRDFSNFLLVGGTWNTLRSLGSIFAGLASNIVAIVPIVLLCAALTIFAAPTRGDLRKPVVGLQWLNFLALENNFTYSINLLLFLTFAATVLVIFAAPFWLLGRGARDRLRSIWIVLVAVPIAVAVLELQPFTIRSYWIFQESRETFGNPSAFCSTSVFRCFSDFILPAVTVVSGVMAAFSSLLGRFLRNEKSSPGLRNAFARVTRVLVYLAAGLAVPVTIWIAYLTLSRWGIAELAFNGQVVCDPARDLAFGAPKWLDQDFCWVTQKQPWIPAPIGFLYLIVGILGVLLWRLTPPNAYSLHSLYRDKVSHAFLQYFQPRAADGPDPKPIDLSVLKLSELKTDCAPYHLVNAALNIHGSRKANERGRNGDFFILSKCFIGSRLTGWCPTKAVEAFARTLDLGTAVTVSGAAASANVGANMNRAVVFSLAMLNIRLGYWLPNPYRLKSHLIKERRAKAWGPVWFLREAFGMLTEESQLVFLTDGGHIENLGLYELLRRRCRTIIVIDAEGDPAMIFPSFVQVQRFARIDLGIRIDIDITEICRRTLDYEPRECGKGPHAAIGTIHYDEDREGTPGEKGILVYIKSSLSGDENDYIREYRRRNTGFPQETTLDQFFSEEQFEAYRALGFHMVQRLFTGEDAFEGPIEKRDEFVAFAKAVLSEDLPLANPLVWSGRSPPALTDAAA